MLGLVVGNVPWLRDTLQFFITMALYQLRSEKAVEKGEIVTLPTWDDHYGLVLTPNHSGDYHLVRGLGRERPTAAPRNLTACFAEM